uniref:THAP domain-containing protein 1 n=1 Tax=Salarias fasciatus TaxID=181472 RepID=A0A672G6U4_SALFA
MPHCVAFGCHFENKGNKGSAVSIHSFPKDRNLRRKWEDACGRVQLPKYPYLCSRHFSADSFEDFHRHQQLKKDAVPTIFVHKRMKRPRVSSESRFKARKRREVLDACLRSEPAAASASLTLRTHFGYDVMVHASMLAALDHNNNVNRKQVCPLSFCCSLSISIRILYILMLFTFDHVSRSLNCCNYNMHCVYVVGEPKYK